MSTSKAAPNKGATAEELYDSLKDALKFFGLRWNDMSAVTVKIRGKKLVLEHNGSEIALDLRQ